MSLTLGEKAVKFEPTSLTEEDLRQALIDAWGKRTGVLLGHAFDGLVWGRLEDGILTVASDTGAIGAALDRGTLLDLRLFDEKVELRVWRGNSGLEGCRVVEVGGGADAIVFGAWEDRDFELLGRLQGGGAKGQFLPRMGRGGERHAPPAAADRLRVRRYFARHPETGLLREAAHRFLAVTGGDVSS